MAISKTRIFNMALNELGISAPIANADAQDDTRTIILNNFYENARDEVLKAFDWNFAEKFRSLTPTTEKCLDPRFNYVYDYPNDCLCAREVYIKDGDGKKKKFKPSANEDGSKVILTNHHAIILKYTRRIENEAYFDAEFANALALYLASLAGQTITGSAERANNALKKYYDKIRQSQISNAQEGQEVDSDNSTYLDAR